MKTARFIKMLAQNKDLWQNYHDDASVRAQLVLHILSSQFKINNSRILDVGCGSGAIAQMLVRHGAKVKAIDMTPRPIISKKKNISFECIMAENLDEAPETYDAVILLDVLEHLKNADIVLKKLHASLKKNGVVYVSTPNKYSLINILNDPHYSLPFISLCNRTTIKNIIHHSLKWTITSKSDYAQLLSYNQLTGLLEMSGFAWKFINRQVARFAFQYPHCIWNRMWHLRVIEKIKEVNCQEFILKIINDYPHFYNRFINPTWYLLAFKR
jgi:SAM-dependent methyltransferase